MARGDWYEPAAIAAKDCIALAALGSGAIRWIRRGENDPARGRPYNVFAYHRVMEPSGLFFGIRPSEFEAQCRFLAHHYRVLPFEDLVARAQAGEPVADAIAITFDDGYRDNYDVALPILEKYGLPATIFVVTEPVTTREPLWHDRVTYVFQATMRERVALRVGDVDLDLRVNGRESRLRAMDQTHRALKKLPEGDKWLAVEDVRRAAGVHDYSDVAGLMMTWDQVRDAARRGFAIGAHTVTHPILTRIPIEQARREIDDGKAAIEAEIGADVTAFAYPNGGAEDFSPAIREHLVATGFRCAGSRGLEPNRPQGDPYDVRRWTPHPFSVARMALKLAWGSRG